MYIHAQIHKYMNICINLYKIYMYIHMYIYVYI